MQSIDLPVFSRKNDAPSIREGFVLILYALFHLSLFLSVIIARKRLCGVALGNSAIKLMRSINHRRKVGAYCFAVPWDSCVISEYVERRARCAACVILSGTQSAVRSLCHPEYVEPVG